MNRSACFVVTGVFIYPLAALAQVTEPPPWYIVDTHLHVTFNGVAVRMPGHDRLVEPADAFGSCQPGDLESAAAALVPSACGQGESFDYEKVLDTVYQNLIRPISSPVKRAIALSPSRGRPVGWQSDGGLCQVKGGNCDDAGGARAAKAAAGDIDQRLYAALQAVSGKVRERLSVGMSNFGACDTISPGYVSAQAPFHHWAGEMDFGCFAGALFSGPGNGPTDEAKRVIARLRGNGPAPYGTVLSTHLPSGGDLDYANFDPQTGTCTTNATGCLRFKGAVEGLCESTANGGLGATVHQTHGYLHLTGGDRSGCAPTNCDLSGCSDLLARMGFLRYWFNRFNGQNGRGFYLAETQYFTPGFLLRAPYSKEAADADCSDGIWVPDALIDFLLEGLVTNQGGVVVSEHFTTGTHLYSDEDFTSPANMGEAFEELTSYWDEIFRRMYQRGLDLGNGPGACQAIQNISHVTAERFLGLNPLPGYLDPCSPTTPRITDYTPKPAPPGIGNSVTLIGENFPASPTVTLRNSSGGVFTPPVTASDATSVTFDAASLLEGRFEVVVSGSSSKSAPFRNLLSASPPANSAPTRSVSTTRAGSSTRSSPPFSFPAAGTA